MSACSCNALYKCGNTGIILTIFGIINKFRNEFFKLAFRVTKKLQCIYGAILTLCDHI